jgi:tellurite methyltransferase
LSHNGSILPSDFVCEWCVRLAAAAPPPRRALDLAMGRGRHAAPLAKAGFRVFGVDAKLEAVRDGVTQLAGEGLPLRAWVADLTRYPLPKNRFELILVTRYLQRDLFPAIRDAIAPGGFVMYETFTEKQRALGRGPTSQDHLLKPGELRGYFDAFEVLFYEEIDAPEALARIVARRRSVRL